MYKKKTMNAIILAAGLGSRFKELTINNHKALFPVNGLPNIERTIQYLKDVNVNDIYIVTGHQNQLFSYLGNKYGCHLIHNEYYKEYNNIYSFYLASKYFHNSLVIDADVVLLDNPFKILKESTYYTILRNDSCSEEWIPLLDENNLYIKNIVISKEKKPSLLGISYWNKNDCEVIKREMDFYIRNEVLLDPSLYWDNIPMRLINDNLINVKTIQLTADQAGEIDNIIDYENILILTSKKN